MAKSNKSERAAGEGRRAAAATKVASPRTPRVAGQRGAKASPRRGAAKARATRKAPAGARAAAGDGPLSRSNIMAFLATADGPRARTFYESVVGLHLMADDPFALVFDGNGVTVRIQKVDRVTVAPYTALGWHVVDIEGTIRGLTARGVRPERYAGLDQDELGVWRSPGGARIAWFRDPDGHVLSLTQW